MSKRKDIVPISAGPPKSDPCDLTISVGDSHLRLRFGPDGKSIMIGPARLIDFPAADFRKLAKAARESDECPDRGGTPRQEKTGMKIFAIDNETHNITMHASAKEAGAVPESERFGTEAALAKLAAHWPAARLVEIWNSVPGAIPVPKFRDRKTGVNRIWKAIQSLGAGRSETAPCALPKPEVVPEEVAAKNKATRTKHMPAARKKETRAGTKTEAILGLMKQPGGTTLQAIMAATSWQAHSVRGVYQRDPRQEDGTHGGFHQGPGRRAYILGQKFGLNQGSCLMPPACIPAASFRGGGDAVGIASSMAPRARIFRAASR